MHRHPYPFLAMVMTTGLFVLATWFTYYGATHYSFDVAIMPVFGGSITAGVSLFRLPFELRSYRGYLQLKRRYKALRAGATEAGPAEIPDEPLETAGPEPLGAGSSLESIVLGGAQPQTVLTLVAGADEPSRFPVINLRAWGLHGQYTREIVGLAWLVALIVATYLFGFTIGVPAFAALYALTATQRVLGTWRSRIIFAVGTAAVLWALTWELYRILDLLYVPRI
jgi:hypothetical protein